jgi:creatinine amidohydrolase
LIGLYDLPHAEARKLASSGQPIYLTVNPVEFHGPHLSLHNDRLVSLGLCRALHERIGGGEEMIVAADLQLGVEPTPGLGTRKASHQVVREQVVRAARGLADLGATRVVIMTFHGAPLHNLAIESGCEALRARGVRALAPFHIVLKEMLLLDDVGEFEEALLPIADARERDLVRAGLKHDFHAGFFETSMALHFAPESVSPAYRELPPCPEVAPVAKILTASRLAKRLGRDLLARELEYAAWGFGWNRVRPFPGYTGRPAAATAASGAVFARRIVERYAAAARAVLDRGERAPQPIMAWADAVSNRFGGISRQILT